MPIPSFQEIMRPWLDLASDGQEHSLQDVIAALGDTLELTSDERSEMLPSGFKEHSRIGSHGPQHTCRRRGLSTGSDEGDIG